MQATPDRGVEAVKAHLSTLKNDVEHKDLDDARRETILGELKVLGRDVNNVKSTYDGTAVNSLISYGLGSYKIAVRREALRCLANALILVPSTQDALAASGQLSRFAEYYGTQDDDDEFLGARILFLMTFNASANMPQVVTDQNVPAKITQHIERHLQSAEPLVGAGMTSMALSETLKLLFNIVNFVPQSVRHFIDAIPNLYSMLGKASIPTPPLQPPLTYLLNALACIGAEESDASAAATKYLPDHSTLQLAVDKLILVLDRSLAEYSQSQLDTQLISVLTILRRINATADADTRLKLKDQLLPQDSERDLPLGQSTTLASRLLKLTTAPGLTHLSEAVSSLLFELSDSDAHTFIRNVGYGYAAGHLMTHKIPIPENARQSSNDGVPVNPVTGQRLDKEPDTQVPAMSQEEKEREAERLFVLFERLKATGVVDVKNPVEQAKSEGRLQEVPASDSD